MTATCTALVPLARLPSLDVRSELDEDDDVPEELIASHEEAIANARKEHEKLRTGIYSMYEDLRTLNPQAEKDIKRLQTELQELLQERQAREQAAGNTGPQDFDESGLPPHLRPPEKEGFRSTRHEDSYEESVRHKECDTVFRRIAFLCHPDKIAQQKRLSAKKQGFLLQILQLAKDARERGDLEELVRLLECAKRKKDPGGKKRKVYLAELQEKLINELRAADGIRKSQDYHMWYDYTHSNKWKVEQFYLNVALPRITQTLVEHIRAIDPSRYVPMQQIQYEVVVVTRTSSATNSSWFLA